MKAEELAVIKERAEKASAGPWSVSDGKDVATEVFYRGYSHSDVDVVAFSDGRINAEFIANARQDVPKLVAEVERKDAEITYLKDVLERVQSDLIPIRGFSVRHDADIVGICANIRRVLDGDDYE